MSAASIPEHLREYITEQQPELYTYIDHASWRYIMRVSKAFFSKHGHPMYLQGLEATGISTDRIPLVSEMNEALNKMGWRAVPINGFIPPSIFLEFQSAKILAIACDMRKLENLGYTPSPDIVHEAAGHAPIVADPSYRAYLEAYGEVARNAIISKYDMELYDAIFQLSEVKEDPHSTQSQIALAQKNFERIASQEAEASEAAVLARMGWWTTEYGLVGAIEKPLIYGAGLLSSVDESYNCLKPAVKKIPFSLDAVLKTSYDITRPQPQLFVAKNFDELTHALDQFANTMAFRRGGFYALEIGRKAGHTVTAVLDHGLQLTGVITEVHGKENNVGAFMLTGAKQIAYMDKASDELGSHHLGSKIFVPLFDKTIASSNTIEIQRKLHGSGLYTKAGLRIQARFKKEIFLGGTCRVLILENVKVVDEAGKTVFEERQKIFPLALAHDVISVFGGAADRSSFALKNTARTQKVASHKTNLTPENSTLNEHYRVVREFREEGREDVESLQPVVTALNQQFQKDWLLRLELLELFHAHRPDSVVTAQLRTQLQQLAGEKSLHDLIQRGIALLH